ncbi:MAG: ABC transporter permease [Phycisphaerales bacterium]|nr:ABC transporter permease [Phycisphaerales bacterium]
MLGQLLAIIRNTFLESIRQPIYIVLLLGQGIITVLLVGIAAFSMADDNKLFLDMCMGAIFGCGVVLSAFLATSVLAKEIENKTVLTVVSKPIGRPVFVIGKYIGVAGAITMAILIMMIYFLLAMRHEVMSTARDKLDQPVLIFSLLALGLSLGIGVWCNYFYNWVFTSTASLALFPLMILAWAGTLIIGKKWVVQSPTTDLDLQVMFALAAVLLAILVLTAVALAASTRLGQVMTLTICLGVFFLGLLGNYLLGRHAINNETLAVVKEVRVLSDRDGDFSDNGDEYFIACTPELSLTEGAPIYFGPRNAGLGIITPKHTDTERIVVSERVKPRRSSFDEYHRYMDLATGELHLPEELAELLPAGLKIVNEGGLSQKRAIRQGDRIYARRTTYNVLALGGWTLLPNLQSFWLTDAITQELPIPARHMGMVALYALLEIIALLSLAVALFQTREVG